MRRLRFAALMLIAGTAAALPLAGQQAGQPAGRGDPPAVVGPREGGRGDTPLPESKPVVWATGRTKVLIVGGGSAHPYDRVFNAIDTASLEAAGFSVNYTEDRDQAATELARADVALLSVNRQYFDTPEYRKAVFDFAAAGKGIVLLHAGTWYQWSTWPEVHQQIIGGGARSHDRITSFAVNVVKPAHPVVQGVPANFTVEDELYHMNAEPDRTPAGTVSIDVLIETSPSVRYLKSHPAVWITSHPQARIVGITIGHDERTHNLDVFKTLLANAVRWTSRR